MLADLGIESYGIYIVFFWGLTGGSPPLLVNTSKPFTGQSVLDNMQKLRQHVITSPLGDVPRELVLTTVPSVLNDIAAAGPEAMRELAQLTRAVVFAGASLAVEIGDMLAAHGVNIVVCYGA